MGNKSLADQLGGLVYSTESGKLCPDCREPVDQCRCTELLEAERLSTLDGIVRVRREVKGRKGKGVTLLEGIPLPEASLKPMLKEFKKRCGTGGALKAGVIEIQGDHRDLLCTLLEQKGYKVKKAGG